ncbi:MAG: AAA family ATPase [Clostridia bacterium]|nr:AAA family ATPase [Clostridia bacterium]
MAYVIGIAGGTASGKSTLTEKLEKQLASLQVQTIHMDTFFKWDALPLAASHLNGKVYEDYNSPETVRWDDFHHAFDEAANSGCDVVLVEGLLVLWDEYLRDKLDVRVFVDCRADERIVRRIRRNTTWGLSFDEITDVYLDMVRFRHDQYVEPTKWTADILINGSGSTDMICDMLVSRCMKKGES